jgi:alcohol dehydrogenase (NADP+)
MATIKDGKGTFVLAAFDEKCELKKHEIGRPDPGPTDVAIDIAYCGMCHSDVHACNGDWSINKYPIAPGHEIAGTVRAVGDKVTNFKVGDKVGVGVMVESCRSCGLCDGGLEQHCPGMIQTYSSDFPAGKSDTFEKAVGYHTNGGYATDITVSEHFVFHIPKAMELEYAGILLCAGVTMFSPLKRHVLEKGGGKGKKVGIVGFGGLGVMGVKLAKAMGAEVTVFSRNNNKEAKAKELGADLLIHTDEEALAAATRTFDVVLDTISANHPVATLVNTLAVGGTYVLIGAVPKPFEISSLQMIFSRQSIEGSLIGGVPETQQMLDFCSEHKIVPEYRVIHAKEASAQFQAMTAGEADAQRAVIDVSTIKDL